MNRLCVRLFSAAIFFLIFTIPPSFADEGGIVFKNPDETLMSIRSNGNVAGYSVYLALPRGRDVRVDKLINSFINKTAHSAIIQDVDGDGYGDVAIQGDCGNRVCESLVFLFDSKSRKLYFAFKKSFSTISNRNGLVVLGGGSGCCMFEFEVIKLSRVGRKFNVATEFYVTVLSSTDPEQDESRCTFMDSNNNIIAPPGREFMGLCAAYGSSYYVVSPEQ